MFQTGKKRRKFSERFEILLKSYKTETKGSKQVYFKQYENV